MSVHVQKRYIHIYNIYPSREHSAQSLARFARNYAYTITHNQVGYDTSREQNLERLSFITDQVHSSPVVGLILWCRCKNWQLSNKTHGQPFDRRFT